MKSVELRNKIKEDFSKYPGVKWKDKYSVVNEGFLGTFNLSFNEPEHLDAFGNYLNFENNLFFAKIQPCIRPDDFELLKKSYKHLSLFEIGGISLSEPDSNKMEEHVKNVVKLIFNFLIDEISLDKNKIHVKLLAGGKISELTNGKYKIAKTIPKDKLQYEEWKKHGVKNFVWDKSRDTFLALFMFKKPSPWGYRSEILYDVGKGKEEKNLLDIGTIEYLPWKPSIKNSEIKGIIKWEHAGIAMAIGVERTLMAVNKYKHIIECDNIFPLYNKILKDAQIKDKKEAFMLTETLRTIHRILADCPTYSRLSRNRKDKFTIYLKNLYLSLRNLKISLSKIEDYLKLNAQLQNYYPELKNNIKKANKGILDLFEQKKFGLKYGVNKK